MKSGSTINIRQYLILHLIQASVYGDNVVCIYIFLKSCGKRNIIQAILLYWV